MLSNRTLFVDSEHGNDLNPGLSEQAPLKSLETASRLASEKAYSILLRRGQTHEGALKVTASGTEENPIIISAYGEGAKPVLSATDQDGIYLTGEYVHVSDLEIHNPDGFLGINIVIKKPGANRGFKISRCDFKDINIGFVKTAYDSGGITLLAGGDEANWFDGVIIEENTFERVARCAVFIHTLWACRRTDQKWGNKNTYVSDEEGWYPNLGIHIRANRMLRVGGDAILLIGAKDALVEYNTVHDSGIFRDIGSRVAYASIWAHSSNRCVFQYNEVSGNRNENNVSDLQAFDADISCKDLIFQYNYSHENAGGFMLLCGDGKENRGEVTGTIVRYNLSVNEADEGYALAVFTITGECYGSRIYNNTVFMKDTSKLLTAAAWSGFGPSDDTVFYNNIFCSANPVQNAYLIQELGGAKFKDNIFYNIPLCDDPRVSNENAVIRDPKLASPGVFGFGREEIGRNYAPTSETPVPAEGAFFDQDAKIDYFGNPIDKAFYGMSDLK